VDDDKRRAAADCLVKCHYSVEKCCVFPGAAQQIVGFVVEGREYVIAIHVGFNAAPVEPRSVYSGVDSV